MRVAALSLADVRMDSIEHYSADITSLVKQSKATVCVLPVYSALLLGLGCEAFKAGENFSTTLASYITEGGPWDSEFLNLHRSMALNCGTYIAAGTVVEREKAKNQTFYYHSAYCYGPGGELSAVQKQTHLTRNERELGFSRGVTLEVFNLGDLKAGMITGNDARHPETGRILALRGVDLVLSSGALEGGFNCWEQAAGMWAQVQQNQFWAVEAQLCGTAAGESFGAGCAVIGPCEITPGQSGYLARGYPESPMVTAELDQAARREIKEKYPLLTMLNHQAYSGLVNDRD